jgi:signal transduction histidine kinase
VSRAVSPLQDEITRALREHLARGGEAELLSGYELGRKALAEELGVLGLVAMLQDALAAACPPDARRAREVIRSAQDFVLECLSPYEMAHRQAREANTALRGLNDLLEEQTRRISRELHDQAGQLVASVHIAIDEVARAAPAATAARLGSVRELLDRVEDQLRRLSHELRPTMLDDLGLVTALEFLAEGVSARTGMAVTVEGPRDERFPAPVETVLYRVAQEALTNVARHARARRAWVRVARDGPRLCCAIRDDGVGFDVGAVLERGSPQGIGLIGMRERLARVGGTLRLTSSPGAGTELLATAVVVGRGAGGREAGDGLR